MNFVTNSSAYSLYPFSTFCRKTSLICGLNKAPTSSIEKYQQHGWDPEFAYADHELMTNATPSECKKNIRRIGDANCWVHHDTTQKNTTYEESVEWCIRYSRDYMEITDDASGFRPFPLRPLNARTNNALATPAPATPALITRALATSALPSLALATTALSLGDVPLNPLTLMVSVLSHRLPSPDTTSLCSQSSPYSTTSVSLTAH